VFSVIWGIIMGGIVGVWGWFHVFTGKKVSAAKEVPESWVVGRREIGIISVGLCVFGVWDLTTGVGIVNGF